MIGLYQLPNQEHIRCWSAMGVFELFEKIEDVPRFITLDQTKAESPVVMVRLDS